MTEQTHAVIYTDGGAKPSRGIGGWGVHGFIFDETVPKVGTGQKDWFLTPTGYVDIKEKLSNLEWLDKWGDLKELAKDPKVKNVNVLNYVDSYGSLIPETTNNIAELTAMTRAIQILIRRNFELVGEGGVPVKTALLITDSRYVKDGLESWVHGWIKNGWVKRDGEPVANCDYWKTLVELRDSLASQGTELTLKWVKGHAGEQDGVDRDNFGNEMADTYCNKAIIAGRKGIQINEEKITEAKGYWKPKVDINRLIAHSRWYFNTDCKVQFKNSTGHHVYHLGDHGKDDDFLGKPMADASFSVLYLKEAEPAMEALRDYQRNLDVENHNSLMISRLDYVFKPTVYQEIVENGGNFLDRKSHKLDLFNTEKLQITKELRPPRLAFNMVEVMAIMSGLLDQAIGDQDSKGIEVTDITDLIYEFGEKKGKTTCKIKPEITSAVKSLSADVTNPINQQLTTISLTLGMDTPHRNALSALGERHPNLKLITWKESNKAFRYATVVTVGEDAGIFAGFYSNIHLLTK